MSMSKKIAIVGATIGTAGIGTSRIIEHILSEVGMTMNDLIIVDGNQMTGQEIQDRINTRETLIEPEPMLITRTDFPEPEYIPTKKELESHHPFAKFMGTKKRKW